MAPPYGENYANMIRVRYENARQLLFTDPDAAELAFKELLLEHQMPLWRRVQCNGILAEMTEHAEDADKYLAEARQFLAFVRTRLPEPEWDGDIAKMADHLDEVSGGIEERRITPWNTEDAKHSDITDETEECLTTPCDDTEDAKLSDG